MPEYVHIFAAGGLTIPALIALGFVRKDEIDYERARNATKDEGGRPRPHGLLAPAKNRQLLWFACGTALFQLADASMLPLAVEAIGRGQSQQGSLPASGLIIAPQVVVALLAPWVGYLSGLRGRKPVLLASFGVQMARAVLMGFISSPVLLIPVQLLDGLSGPIRSTSLRKWAAGGHSSAWRSRPRRADSSSGCSSTKPSRPNTSTDDMIETNMGSSAATQLWSRQRSAPVCAHSSATVHPHPRCVSVQSARVDREALSC